MAMFGFIVNIIIVIISLVVIVLGIISGAHFDVLSMNRKIIFLQQP
ncbi:hypothetical protein SDC9_138266 [bioreactor metagenome]|uniref:Uncharacterized protein n=1 Tax=bioreactor metagenome TaxID=1076179 RepID=A0A645DNU7_9ZZZZ